MKVVNVPAQIYRGETYWAFVCCFQHGDTGAKYGVSHVADESVVVMPLCTVEGSVFCIPSAENCFPFCMGLYAVGQTTQNISLLNTDMWNDHVSD